MKEIIEDGPIFKSMSYSKFESLKLSNEDLSKIKGGGFTVLEDRPIM